MTNTASLSELKSEPEFLTITHAATAGSSSSPALSAIWSTLSLLSQSSCRPNWITFIPPYLSLVLSSSAQNIRSIPSEEGRFVKDLTHAAHVTSALLSCSSVLAGLSSDSDQFGDVGILLPVLEGDRETEVVNLLGLGHWLRNGGKIIKYLQTSSNMPCGLAQIPQTQKEMATSQLDNLTSLLSQLHDPFQFRLEGGQGNEGTVIWFLLGTINLDKKPAWAGLLGAGTWADF